MSTIDDLPPEILTYIFKLTRESAIVTLWVSKRWHEIFKTFNISDDPNKITLTNFIEHYDVPYLEYLRSLGCPYDIVTCIEAVKHNKLDTLIWLRTPTKKYRIAYWGIHTCNEAAINGNLEILKWLRDPKTGGGVCPWNLETLRKAAKAGHINIILYLREMFGDTVDFDRYNDEISHYVALGGYFDILKSLPSYNIPLNGYTCAGAAKAGRIDMLEWLRNPETGYGTCLWNIGTCAYAAKHGIRVLKWLRDPETGGGICPWSAYTCANAAKYHDIELLEWLRDPDTGGGVCAWNELSCKLAVTYGPHKRSEQIVRIINTLEWLRDPETGGGICPWDIKTTMMAARTGSIELLEWLRNPKTGGGICPWEKGATLQAVRFDHLELLKWLRNPETGGGVCPWNRRHLLKIAKPEIKAWLETQAD